MSTLELARDCARCAALCCVAPSFAVSEDFAVDKPAGEACPHLGRDHLCTIFDERPAHGFPACVGYECHGAGQRVTAAFAGRRGLALDEERAMHEAFYVVRGLHQALALVVAAAALPQAAPLAGALSAVAEHLDDAVRRALAGDPDAAPAALGDAQALLRRVGVLVATERARSLPVVNDHGGLSPPARDRAPSRTPRRRA